MPWLRRQPRATGLIPATLLIALVASSINRGAYTAPGQRILLLLAGVALLLTVAALPAALARALRTRAAVVLLLLAILSAVSASWTIGTPGDAIRWSLVILVYAVLVVIGAALALTAGARPIAIVIGLFAVIQVLIGDVALVFQTRPLAVLVLGSWRPGGTFEYPPALAILAVCGLPGMLLAASSERRALAIGGGLALSATGVVFGCVDSRTPVVLAAIVLIALAKRADRAVLRDGVAPAASMVLIAVGAISAAAFGAHASHRTSGGGGARLLTLVLLLVVISRLWPWFLDRVRTLPRRRVAWTLGVIVLAGAVLWLGVGHKSTLTGTRGGVDHARANYWRSAYRAWHQRPLLGSGAETFYLAAERYQPANEHTLFAHNLPLEAAAELGVGGLVLSLLLYGVVLRDVRRWWRRDRIPIDNELWLVAPAAACFLLENLVDWSWHLASVGGAWALATGGLAALLTRQPG